MNYVLPSSTLNMGHMKRRPGGDRVCENFLKSRKIFRFGSTTRANVHVNRGAVSRSSVEHLQDFPVCSSGRVGWPEPNCQRTTKQPLFYARQDVLKLRRCSAAMRGVAPRQEASGIVHDRHPRGNMARADSIVDKSLALASRVPCVNIGGAKFQLQRSRDSIGSFSCIVFGVLTVLVEVNKSRGDDQIFRFDVYLTSERLGGDGSNLPRADSDITDRIESCFGIHYAPICNCNVVGVLCVCFMDSRN